MQSKSSTNIERIIAKIDNDFNPDGSDWIPRVGAWVVDAMSQLDVTIKERKRKKIPVNSQIAYSPCKLDYDNLKVYDSNGCVVKEMGNKLDECGCPLRGIGNDEECSPRQAVVNADGSVGLDNGNDDTTESSCHEHIVYHRPEHNFTPDTVDIVKQQANRAPDVRVNHVNCHNPNGRYNVVEMERNVNNTRNYVISGGNKIQLNFDDDFIYIEYDDIKTECSSIYGCELPSIPNNGLLIEAIVYYCMYKMLCRGYQHPVMNLKASQYGTNPYYEWNKLKDEAKRSSIIDAQGNVIDDSSLWQSAFYIYTFCR